MILRFASMMTVSPTSVTWSVPKSKLRVSSDIFVAADVTRRIQSESTPPPPHVGGYELRINPHQSASRQSIEQRQQIIRREVNTAARRRPAERGFVAGAVQINVARVRIH